MGQILWILRIGYVDNGRPVVLNFSRQRIQRRAGMVADVSDPDLQERSHAVLRPHTEVLQRNRLLRGIQSQVMLQWETGKPPLVGGEMTLFALESDIANTLNEMAPHARRLMWEVLGRKKYGDFRILAECFDLMRRWGVDPEVLITFKKNRHRH